MLQESTQNRVKIRLPMIRKIKSTQITEKKNAERTGLTFQTSLTSTSVSGGITKSSQLAVMGSLSSEALFKRSTAVLYPDSGPAQIWGDELTQSPQMAKHRNAESTDSMRTDSELYLLVSFHPDLLCLHAEGICSGMPDGKIMSVL